VILESNFSDGPHEYLRDTLEMRYRRCSSCGNRTEFTCITCSFCWSCHWKKEQVEKFELLDRSFKGGKLPPPSPYPVAQEKGRQERRPEKTANYLSTAKAINVFGIRSEPICDYLRCRHEFSSHGLRTSKCKCKHPQNAAIGA
jgi:hypothetical protein